MLLVFFLVTSSMYVDKGILRQLPPKDREDTPQQELHVDQDDIMAITIDANGQISVNDTIVPSSSLSDQMRAFILSRGSKHLFTIETDPYTPYSAYFDIQNDLSQAYRDARESLSQRTYHKPVADLTDDERLSLFTSLPHRVAENYHTDSPQ